MSHKKRFVRLSRLVAGFLASTAMATAILGVMGVIALNPVPLAAATSCEDLAKISLPNVRITLPARAQHDGRDVPGALGGRVRDPLKARR